ncbi:hypothetical protein GYB59_00625 [bacterium]|nr:hypothetical protein [bacterium]
MPRPQRIAEPPTLRTPFQLIVDTREQAPYHFCGIPDDKTGQVIVADLVNQALPSGDYSIVGLEDRVAIERKSHADFLGSIGKGRERFQREMERLSQYDYAAVVIEADWNHLINLPPTSSQISPKTAVRTVLSWSIRYGVHFWPCMNRRHAELTTFRLLERYWKIHQEKERADVTNHS